MIFKTNHAGERNLSHCKLPSSSGDIKAPEKTTEPTDHSIITHTGALRGADTENVRPTAAQHIAETAAATSLAVMPKGRAADDSANMTSQQSSSEKYSIACAAALHKSIRFLPKSAQSSDSA